jgi:hypothetical protein
MGWSWVGQAPGLAQRLARLEAVERAQEERRKAEARERFEDAYERRRIARMQELASRGVWFDPNDDNTLAVSLEELMARGFAVQDLVAMEAERDARRIAKEAGILDALGLPHRLDAAEVSAPGDGDAGGGVVGQVAPPPAVSASRMAVRSKVRRALERTAHRATRGGACGCASCVPGQVARGDDSEGPTITRFTEMYR